VHPVDDLGAHNPPSHPQLLDVLAAYFVRTGYDVNCLVRTLAARGVTAIVSHPERHRQFQKEPEQLRALVAAGALSQVTAASVAGKFGRSSAVAAQRLLELGLVHVIASDAHSHDHRPPVLSDGVAAAALVVGALTLVNYLGTMGWSISGDREKFTVPEGAKVPLKVKLGKSATKKLKKAGKLKCTAVVKTTDAAGQTTTVEVDYTFKKKKKG